MLHKPGLFGYLNAGSTIKNLCVSGTVSGSSDVGGIAGRNNAGTVENCCFEGTVSGLSGNVGGIVGYNGSDGIVTRCLNTGTVTGNGNYAGGVVGQNYGTVTYSYNTGAVGGNAVNTGGIAGFNSAVYASVQNCYNTGAVEGRTNTGGIAGQNKDNAVLQNCYSIGSVEETSAFGDIAGLNTGAISGCYYLSDLEETQTAGATGITESAFADIDTFDGWSFSEVWKLDASLKRPVLRMIPEGGSAGTAEDPYLISHRAALEALQSSVDSGNSFAGKYILVTADICLYGDETNPWIPIGAGGSCKFNGTFDGGGHEISGLYINGTSDNQGLFSSLAEDGTIKDLRLSGTVTGGNYVGGLAGRNNGKIDNCQSAVSVAGSGQVIGGLTGMNNGTVINSQNTGTVSGMMSVGGVIGYNGNNCEVKSCVNAGEVTGTVMYTGGVAGMNNGGSISGCENSGTISGASFTGGVAGHTVSVTAGADADAVIESCNNTGTVSGTNGIGGIVGSIGNADSVVSGCYNGGSVSSTASDSAVGGIAGYNNGTLLHCQNDGADGSTVSSAADGAKVGGIAGGNTGVISNSYNLGEVSASGGGAAVGGVAGASYTNVSVGSISSCYSVGAVFGTGSEASVGGVVGTSDTESGCSVSNSYYLADTETDVEDGITGKTAAQFASGAVAYLLQSGQQDDGSGTIPQVWGQTLAGDAPDAAPVLTADAGKAVYKVAFMADGAEYAAAYANPNGTVTLPQQPDSEIYEFVKWAQTNEVDGAEFTAQTPVAGDMTVYAVVQEMYTEAEIDKTITTTYGTAVTRDLSDYMDYAADTEPAGKFRYEITGGNIDDTHLTANGNWLAAQIDGDTLTIQNTANADTYTLLITATEKEPVISLLSADYGTQPVEFEITVVIDKAEPIVVTAPRAERVRKNNRLSTATILDGVVAGLDGVQNLTGTWTWKNDREMTQTGTFMETAVFTPTDTNYAQVKVENVSVMVYEPINGGGSVSVVRYTVTFDTQGGSEIDSISVARNGFVTKPNAPIREGYTFAGWFTDAECKTAFDFDTRITDDLTLYAKWEQQATVPVVPVDPTEPDEPEEWKNPYTDVSEEDWFFDAVRYAQQQGLFSGVTATSFAPDEAITRGMLVTVLWRSEKEPVVNYLMTFSDVDEQAYYAEAVRWAASERIVRGYSDTEFAPNQLISREEMAAIINRYAVYKGLDASASGDLTGFADQAQIADWARENLAWAVGNGIISGKENNLLDPQGSTTRAETAAILQRLLEK